MTADTEKKQDQASKAYPLAPMDLTNSLLDLVQQASSYKQLKKGT